MDLADNEAGFFRNADVQVARQLTLTNKALTTLKEIRFKVFNEGNAA